MVVLSVCRAVSAACEQGHFGGIGTGCIVDLDVFAAMGCDAAVVCDDGCAYWRDAAWALESGLSVIRVSHGVSEEPGMRTLAAHVAGLFPALQVMHHSLSLRIH